MAALNFPTNPTPGQVYNPPGGPAWTWDGVKWTCSGGGGGTGPPGPAGTIQIGVTQTLTPGSHATVSNTGTSSAAILNFGIPAGAQGTPGSGLSFVGVVATTAQLPVPGVQGEMYLVTANEHLYVWVSTPSPGQWVDTGASPGGGIPEAPTDGQVYGRSGSSWISIIDDGVF